MSSLHRLRLRSPLLALGLATMLAACGGGDDRRVDDGPLTCSVRDQQAWLADYMDEWYFWYRLAPRPNPGGYTTVTSYFDALLFTGDATFPADRWSGSESTESFNRFYGDGATLGYGVSVNGIEAVDRRGGPLFVRYVEPRSDAAAQGVRRGDEVVSVNGRSAADLIAANDFSALSPGRAGEVLDLVLRTGGGLRSVRVVAAVYSLTPVAGTNVYQSIGGRRIGYLAVKDMIAQAGAPLDDAFAYLRGQGVQDLILDLRYNGGGLVSTAASVASYVAGTRGSGRVFASLLYNDKRAGANNQSFAFSSPAQALGLARVFVLAGPRTCSASEQVINGLRGVGVQVVAVGDTTCGKPVGFLPADGRCGTTYSVVNFESVNAANQGRYFDGFDATCPVAEDYSIVQGAAADPLVASAAWFADTGQCAPTTSASEGRAFRLGVSRATRRTPGWLADERSDMVGR
jgi:hypothetical protein